MQFKPLERFTTLLGKGWVGTICVCIAVLNKCLVSFWFSSLRGDKAIYLLFAQSFLETGKFTEPVSLVETGATVHLYEPAIHSPLYSLIAAPLLWLTNSFFWSQFIISVFGWILFYTAVYKIAVAVLRRHWVVHLFILVSGFFLYPHELSSTPKDTLAVGFALWSIYLVCKFVASPQLKTTCLLALTIACVGATKLLYFPLAVLFVFLLVAILFLEGNRKHFLHLFLLVGFICLAAFLVNISILKPAHDLTVANDVFLPRGGTPLRQGFFPQNLLHTYPFVSGSFLNTELWGVQFGKFTDFSFGEVMKGLLALDAILLTIIIVVSLFYSRQIIANKVLFLLIGAAFIMMAVTFFMSATQEAEVSTTSSYFWTFVTDARSFLLPILVIQLVLFLFIFRFKKLSVLRWIFLLLFLSEAAHGMYFSVKEVTHRAGLQKTDQENRIVAMIQQEREKADVKLITTDNSLRRFALVNNLSVFAFTNKPANLSWMRRGDIFIIATHEEDAGHLKIFPLQSLVPVDTVGSIILHRFEAK
ncbi:MAG: hypothetical protein EOO10_14045 [Chitinophagaceae bacterium]|nr:MAG: hypothetical protein EOO10_14045 [Chitinophagaceae bacterium]